GLQLLSSVTILHTADVNLRHDRHCQSKSPRTQEIVLRLYEIPFGRILKDAQKIPAGLGTKTDPIVVEKERVRIQIGRSVDLQAREQLKQRGARLAHVDPRLISDFSYLGAIAQRDRDHVVETELQLGHSAAE